MAVSNYERYFGNPVQTSCMDVERYKNTETEELIVQVWLSHTKIVEIPEKGYLNWLVSPAQD